MTERSKKQHYVPRLILKRFVGHDPEGMVWTYDKQETSGFPRPSLPKETAVETNFHTVLSEDGTPNDAVELWLSKIESYAEEPYEMLVHGDIPTGAKRAYFSHFAATLFARSPGMRRIQGELLGSKVQATMNVITASKERFKRHFERHRTEIGAEGVVDLEAMYEFMVDKSNYVIEIHREATLKSLEFSDSLAEILQRMSWCVLSTVPKRPFITTDLPLIRVVRPDTHHPVYGDGGFANKTAVVTLPLSPTRILQMTWDEEHADRVVSADRELVKIFNRGRAGQAERFLYADRYDEGIRRLAAKYKDDRMAIVIEGLGEQAAIEVKRKLSQ